MLLDDGQVLAYDELVLATGAAPFVPPVPGRELPGVLRLPDHRGPRRDPRRRAGPPDRRRSIGGGLLGLEAANALVQLGLQTTWWRWRRG